MLAYLLPSRQWCEVRIVLPAVRFSFSSLFARRAHITRYDGRWIVYRNEAHLADLCAAIRWCFIMNGGTP